MVDCNDRRSCKLGFGLSRIFAAKDEGAGTKGSGQSGRLDGSFDTTVRGGTKPPSMSGANFIRPSWEGA